MESPGAIGERVTSTGVVSESRETSRAPIRTLATTRTIPTISRGSFQRGLRSLITDAVAPTAFSSTLVALVPCWRDLTGGYREQVLQGAECRALWISRAAGSSVHRPQWRRRMQAENERLVMLSRQVLRPEGSSMTPRFVPLSDVAETLSISASQAYALVRSGELRAIKVGGRGQWRVEVTEIESYIQRSYEATEHILQEERRKAEQKD